MMIRFVVGFEVNGNLLFDIEIIITIDYKIMDCIFFDFF